VSGIARIHSSSIDAYYEINLRTKVKGRFIRLEKDKYLLKFNPKSNPNLSLELERLINQWEGSNIKVNFQLPNERLVSLALLRIAYLKMFSVFGYGYFFSKSSQQIRAQLTSPKEKIITNLGIPHSDDDLQPYVGINLITFPKEIKSYLVIIKLKHESRSKTIPIVMPGPEDDYADLINRFQRLGRSNYNLTSIMDIDYLTVKNRVLAYHKIWNAN
jgi:hypothetical protein